MSVFVGLDSWLRVGEIDDVYVYDISWKYFQLSDPLVVGVSVDIMNMDEFDELWEGECRKRWAS